MRIYLAGTSVSDPKKEKRMQKLFKNSNKLHSYFHLDQLEKKWYHMNKKNKVELFLDSGAFSGWSQGKLINILDYINFIKENKNDIKKYSNLDVIGDAAATWKNQKIMEKHGLNPIPVFHYGSPIKYLEKMLKRNYEYISLGGMVPISTKNLIPWLDDLWLNYLTDKDGMPICKVHGFGLTSFVLMGRYPWYSVDSTSWVVTGRLGSIYVPRKKGGKYIYDENSWKIAVSNKSPKTKEAGQHFTTLSPFNQKIVKEYLKEKGYCYGRSEFRYESQDYQLKENEKWCGKKPKDKTVEREVELILEEGVSNTYQLRDELNIIYFLDLEKTFPKWPWKFKLRKQNSFFQ